MTAKTIFNFKYETNHVEVQEEKVETELSGRLLQNFSDMIACWTNTVPTPSKLEEAADVAHDIAAPATHSVRSPSGSIISEHADMRGANRAAHEHVMSGGGQVHLHDETGFHHTTLRSQGGQVHTQYH